ncbi:hypothetical protein [Sporosarcina limicola]|uniref:Uncharacterized protein n=1 Tax=Sporosarcina limicola TaxID=34101 RepID=A0A927MLN3_9BACL|nr:hypothetical protein [Sporosarcina limicola]MBE1556999.1 hypothetical protein [Sporosarcina limicola]
MARIKNTRSGGHMASLVENQRYQLHWIMKRLERDKKLLANEGKQTKARD